MMNPRPGLLTALSCLALLVTLDARAQAADGQHPVDPVSHASALDETEAAPGASAADDPIEQTVPALLPSDEDETAVARFPPVDVTLNQKVLQYIQQFSTTRKKFLEDGLARGARYLPMIQSIFREEGLPEELVYLPLIESAFKTKATSRAGASGIWQFMKGTATFNGLTRDWYVDERSDPEKSTRAAARLLKTLYGMFGDWHLALAAYNAGGGRVQQALKRSKAKNYWDLTATSRYLPKETRDYVPLFLASVTLARNPLQYGLNIASLDTPLHDLVSVTSPLDLRRVAEWLGTGVDVLQELNPELRRWTTPVRATSYALRVPAGMGTIVETRLAAGAPADLDRHVVKKGETLASIARKLKVTRAELAEANYLSASAMVRAGDSLVVPRPPAVLAPAIDAATPGLLLASADHVGPTPSGASGVARLVHLVMPGDTVDSIARVYSTSVAYLKEWNGDVVDAISPGTEITVFWHTPWSDGQP